MIALGIVLLLIGIFIARNILWPVAGVRITIGLILWIVSAATSPVCGGAYGCY